MKKWRSQNSTHVKSVRCSVCRIGTIRVCPRRSGKSSYIAKKYVLSKIFESYFLQSKQSLSIFHLSSFYFHLQLQSLDLSRLGKGNPLSTPSDHLDRA